MTTQEKTQIIERFELFWGEAPEGSLKHKRGQEVLAHLLKEIEDAEGRAEKRTAMRIIHQLDELEMNQPEDLKTDNWRNWKYIRNSIVDEYDILEALRNENIASLSDREGEAKPEILKDGGDYVVSNEERKKIM